MLEDEAARLEEHVGEALFSVSWLEYAKAAGVAEASVKPTTDQNVCKHVNLPCLQLDPAFSFACICFLLIRLRLELKHVALCLLG